MKILHHISTYFLQTLQNLELFYKIFSRQKVFKESAALTFVTLMGFVPFLIFTIFLLPEIPFLSSENTLKEALISVFLPASADQIVAYVEKIIEQRASFSFFNFIILIITSFGLFRIINDTFDTILNVHEARKKDFLFNFIKFLGMIIFGFLIILLLFSSMSLPIISNIFKIGFLQILGVYILPFLLLFIIILLFYLFVPTIKIKKRTIIFAAAISSFVWFMIKMFFNWYISNLTNIEVIYGVLATIPIFIFWIYINWTIILGGVVIVSMVEKRYLHHKDEKVKDNDNIKITIEGQVDKELIYNKLFKYSGKELYLVLQNLINKKEGKDISDE